MVVNIFVSFNIIQAAPISMVGEAEMVEDMSTVGLERQTAPQQPETQRLELVESRSRVRISSGGLVADYASQSQEIRAVGAEGEVHAVRTVSQAVLSSQGEWGSASGSEEPGQR